MPGVPAGTRPIGTAPSWRGGSQGVHSTGALARGTRARDPHLGAPTEWDDDQVGVPGGQIL